MSVQTETLHHPPVVPRTELGRALLAAATGDLTRHSDGRVLRYAVSGVELSLEAVLVLSGLHFATLLYWLPLWGHGEYACRTEAGHALLDQWNAELFGERA